MDLRLYTQIFDKAGIPCTVLTPAQLADDSICCRTPP